MTVTLDRPTTIAPAPVAALVPAPRPADPVAFVASLGYGLISMALNASDMPTQRPTESFHTTEQTAAWVIQGIERVGGVERLWWLDYRFRELNGRETPLSAAERREYTALRGPRRRQDRCNGQAYHFSHASGYPLASFPAVVRVTECVYYAPGDGLLTRERYISQRDHDNLNRYTAVKADGTRTYVGPDSRREVS